jgi:hypothetical protein
VDIGCDTGHPAQLAKIANQAIRNVHRCRSMGPHGLCQRIARLRQQIARQEMLPLRFAQVPVLALTYRDAERSIADCSRDEYAISSPGADTAHHCSLGNHAKHGDRDHDRPLRAIGITPEQRAAELCGVVAQTGREPFKPRFADFARQHKRQEETNRARAFRGKV